MIKKTIKIILYFILAGLVAGLFYYYSQPIADFAQPAIIQLNTAIKRQLATLSPACQKPIYYSLGEIDSRFNLSDGEIIEEYLARTFPALNQPQLVWTTAHLKSQRYEPGAAIIRKGQPSEKFYIVTNGSVEVVLEALEEPLQEQQRVLVVLV